MKPNPDNIEDELKAAAAKRREAQGEPFALGPVERAALLRDVRTQWPPATPARKALWWDMFSGRLAWASSIAAFALLVAGVLVRTGRSPAAPEVVAPNSVLSPSAAPVKKEDRLEMVEEKLANNFEELPSTAARELASDSGPLNDASTLSDPAPTLEASACAAQSQ